MSIKSPRGTKDILPGEVEKWQKIEETARELFLLYNYREIRTPVFEDTSLFERSIGEKTDIVEKEMYTFPDKKGRSLTLRPEGTAPVVRAYLEHKLYGGGGLNKFFYMGPFFRYERPQAGRNRQFHQVGAEAIGSDNPGLDAEIISLTLHFLRALGLETLQTEINSIGCSVCQPGYRKKLIDFLRSVKDELCSDCSRRIESNPLRTLDCKNERCISILKDAPVSLSYLCEECRKHFDTVKRVLDMLDINFRNNSRLVRGLDYYTRTTFEIVHSRLGAQDAVAAGGRFDGLVEEMGGKSAPAVGVAAGVERIALLMDKDSSREPVNRRVCVFVVCAGAERFEEAVLFVDEIRHAGISAEIDYERRSLKSQLRAANKLGVAFAVLLNEEGFLLKDMAEGKQKKIEKQKLIAFLKDRCG